MLETLACFDNYVYLYFCKKTFLKSSPFQPAAGRLYNLHDVWYLSFRDFLGSKFLKIYDLLNCLEDPSWYMFLCFYDY